MSYSGERGSEVSLWFVTTQPPYSVGSSPVQGKNLHVQSLPADLWCIVGSTHTCGYSDIRMCPGVFLNQ